MHQNKTNSLTYMIMIICDLMRSIRYYYYKLIVKACEMKMLNQDSNIEWKKRRRKTVENKREMLLSNM